MFPPEHGGRRHESVQLSSAAALLDALTLCATLDLDRLGKARWLLERITPLIVPGYDYHVLLLEELEREPFPRLVDRVTFGPTFDLIEPREHDSVQALLDLCAPMSELSVPRALKQLRVPTTYLYSEDAEPDWFQNVFVPRLLRPNFWEDCMAGYWAGSADRMILFNAFRPTGGRPFTIDDQKNMSLACRTVAPVMDSDLFARSSPMEHESTRILLGRLPPELHPLLLVVLQGHSPMQIARLAGKLLDEVEIALRTMCECMGVASTGELIARFVDDRVLNWLEKESTR